MKFSVKRIRGKKPFELYTPAGLDKDGYSDREKFQEVAGSVAFHSFQVWRTKSGAPATCVYVFTLSQINELLVHAGTHKRSRRASKSAASKVAKAEDTKLQSRKKFRRSTDATTRTVDPISSYAIQLMRRASPQR
jgi:hypothetical protein